MVERIEDAVDRREKFKYKKGYLEQQVLKIRCVMSEWSDFDDHGKQGFQLSLQVDILIWPTVDCTGYLNRLADCRCGLVRFTHAVEHCTAFR